MQARPLPNVVCRFYAKGYCKNGWSCAFVHETSRNDCTKTKTNSDADVTVEAEPCRYFKRGKCLKGDRCNFSHDQKHILCKEEDNKLVIVERNSDLLTIEDSIANNNTNRDPITDAEIKNKESSVEEKNHRDLEHSTQSKAQLDLECAICLESVLKHHKQFGLLTRCDHVFCLDCIRSWRQPSNGIESNREQHHVCPICRVKSYYVVPSAIYVTGEDKKRIIYEYRQKLKSIPCKYYKQGRSACPFADRCFYLHGNPQRSTSVAKPPRSIAPRNNNVDSTVDDIASEDKNARRATSAHSPGEFKYERIGILARAIQYARALRRGNEQQYGHYEQDYLLVRANEELNLELSAIVAKDGKSGAAVEEDTSRAEEVDFDQIPVMDAVVHQRNKTDSDDVDSDDGCSYETGWD